MGVKGDKYSNVVDEVTKWLITQLSSIEAISMKKMFGGIGVFQDRKMFGIINPKGQILFKAKDQLADELLAKGSEKKKSMPYYSIPDDILDDQQELLSWAQKSISQSK